MKTRKLAITLLTMALGIWAPPSVLAHTPDQCDDVVSDSTLPKCHSELAYLCTAINSAGDPLKPRDRANLDGKFHMALAKLRQSKIYDVDKKLWDIHAKVSTLRDLALANPTKAKIDVGEASTIIDAIEGTDGASQCVLAP